MLNPQTLSDYVGQDRIKKNLRVVLESSKKTLRALDHILFSGPAGLGKTSLAEVVAKEIGRPIIKLMGPQIKDPEVLNVLYGTGPRTILFIDEIHSLPLKVEESLYELMDGFTLRGHGVSSFTLIGATTLEGAISKPLRSRFTIVERLTPYEVKDLCAIVAQSATALGLTLDDKVVEEIAKRSRGTPRIAKHLLKRISYYGSNITLDNAQEALDSLGVDKFGLELLDRAILRTMHLNFSDGPVGIQSLANVVGEDITTIDSREHYLVSLGFVQRTGRGRILTTEGIKYVS